MSQTAARWLIVLVAVTHAAIFIAYQRPDWQTQWGDQVGYTRLGRALAERGRFTRYPDSPRYIPEVLRTPGYPLFVAGVDRVLGGGRLRVAAAQAVVFACICLLVSAMARLVLNDRWAWLAGLATALYSPLPYYSALTLTEVLATFFVTAGTYLWLRAARGGAGRAAAAGAALACAALTRPSFQYLPVAFAAFAVVVAPRDRRAARQCLFMIATYLLAVTPWLLYNFTYFRTLTFSPVAGSAGRVLWEGSWQGVFPGKVQSTLTHVAETNADRGALDGTIREYADELKTDPTPLLQYAHQWKDLRSIWDEPQDPTERPSARIAAYREYRRVAFENIRHDPIRYVWRRATRGLFVLWAAEIPIRYSDINSVPAVVIRAIWIVQVFLIVAAAGGWYLVWRGGARAEAAALAALAVYVTAVHVVLYSEARYSLPAKPAIVLLATIAACRLFLPAAIKSFERPRSGPRMDLGSGPRTAVGLL